MRYGLFVFLQAAGGVVLIGSELTQSQHKQINRAAQLLGGKQAKAFSSAGTSDFSSCVRESVGDRSVYLYDPSLIISYIKVTVYTIVQDVYRVSVVFVLRLIFCFVCFKAEIQQPLL